MAATWTKQGPYGASVVSLQALTEAAPALVSDGIDVSGLASILPVLVAPLGQTLTGAGFLRWYYYSPVLAQWMPVPTLDDELVDFAGKTFAPLQPVPIQHNHGRMALLADAVGVTGGATLTLYLLGTDRVTRAAV